MKLGFSPHSSIEERRGKFSMLPRSSKWMECNITLPTWDPKSYQKFYGRDVGKVGPSFDKLDKRDYLLYSSDLTWRAGYIDLGKYDKSYLKLGHVEKPTSVDMSKMLRREQFDTNPLDRPSSAYPQEAEISQTSNRRQKNSKQRLSTSPEYGTSLITPGRRKVHKNFSNLLMEHGYIKKPSDVNSGKYLVVHCRYSWLLHHKFKEQFI